MEYICENVGIINPIAKRVGPYDISYRLNFITPSSMDPLLTYLVTVLAAIAAAHNCELIQSCCE